MTSTKAARVLDRLQEKPGLLWEVFNLARLRHVRVVGPWTPEKQQLNALPVWRRQDAVTGALVAAIVPSEDGASYVWSLNLRLKDPPKGVCADLNPAMRAADAALAELGFILVDGAAG